jgi:hypothetical protein
MRNRDREKKRGPERTSGPKRLTDSEFCEQVLQGCRLGSQECKDLIARSERLERELLADIVLSGSPQ